jgi:hypothetical protein
MDKTISLTRGGDGSDFLLQVHDELQHPEVSVDIDAIITRPFPIYQLDQKDSVALEDFPAALQGGKHLLRTGQCPPFMLETGSCWTRIHDRGNVAAQCNPSAPPCSPLAPVTFLPSGLLQGNHGGPMGPETWKRLFRGCVFMRLSSA